jgi:hypothetical protein
MSADISQNRLFHGLYVIPEYQGQLSKSIGLLIGDMARRPGPPRLVPNAIVDCERLGENVVLSGAHPGRWTEHSLVAGQPTQHERPVKKRLNWLQGFAGASSFSEV